MQTIRTSASGSRAADAGSRGFSLIEILVATAVLAIVGGGIVTFLYQGQQTFHSQTDLNRSGAQARVAIDQVVRYIRHAGNDPLGFLEASGITPIELVTANHIRVNSDITGSVPSTSANDAEATGDPDGTLDSIHERVGFRFDQQAQSLFMDVGYGEQLLAENVTNFNLTFFDRSGTATTVAAEISRIHIEMTAGTSRKDMQTGEINRFTLHSDVFLRSQSFDPYAVVEGG